MTKAKVKRFLSFVAHLESDPSLKRTSHSSADFLFLVYVSPLSDGWSIMEGTLEILLLYDNNNNILS